VQIASRRAFQVADMSVAPEPTPSRPPDKAETSEVVTALRTGKQYALLIATEHMTRLSVGWRPPTARQVDWFHRER
jgi:hypothetical protein